MYKRPIFNKILKRLEEPRGFIQVLSGPRQVGKTTLSFQLKEAISFPSHYASADEPTLQDSSWIEQQWEIGRLRTMEGGKSSGALLILDEVQKIPHWSEAIKRLWDEDTSRDLNLKVMILGSSALLVQKGLTESLAGRFELTHITHWSFKECHEAFGWTLEQYIYFGGYPGAAVLIEDEERWSRYVIDSLIETSISRDIMLMARVHKPALLRRVFELGCHYSGQILSYQKMLGQLQDAGNATTLAHYLELLSGAGLVMGLPKFYFERVRQKASSPKLQVLNTALITAQGSLSFKEAQEDREAWGRLVESTIGAHLINSTLGTKIEVSYWREGNKEVDFILRKGENLVALEVKSSQRRTSLPGMEAFSQRFHPQKKLLIGGQGIPLKEFLMTSPEYWI
ncbi:MAG: AAA family ATPase [Alphaproteobacteria bacterium 41-28]|nr:MAG: AAA family ATPase [Alphaproteobacteria bacterium 41-28]